MGKGNPCLQRPKPVRDGESLCSIHMQNCPGGLPWKVPRSKEAVQPEKAGLCPHPYSFGEPAFVTSHQGQGEKDIGSL